YVPLRRMASAPPPPCPDLQHHSLRNLTIDRLRLQPLVLAAAVLGAGLAPGRPSPVPRPASARGKNDQPLPQRRPAPSARTHRLHAGGLLPRSSFRLIPVGWSTVRGRLHLR